MAKRKLKIVPDPREPNGRIVRPSAAQLRAIEREQRLKETAIVRNQPHRRGSDHPWLENPFGRYCLGNHIPVDLHTAGERYASLIRSWRLAMGLPCPFGRSSEGLGGDGTIDPEHILAKVNLCMAVMERANKNGADAVNAMCSANRDIHSSEWGVARTALQALHDYLTGLDRKAPSNFGSGVTAWRGSDNVFIVEQGE